MLLFGAQDYVWLSLHRTLQACLAQDHVAPVFHRTLYWAAGLQGWLAGWLAAWLAGWLA